MSDITTIMASCKYTTLLLGTITFQDNICVLWTAKYVSQIGFISFIYKYICVHCNPNKVKEGKAWKNFIRDIIWFWRTPKQVVLFPAILPSNVISMQFIQIFILSFKLFETSSSGNFPDILSGKFLNWPSLYLMSCSDLI